MSSHPPDIMTVEDTAEFLRIPLSSVYKLAQAGKIPGQKVGRHWRFYRPALERWIAREAVAPQGAVQSEKTAPVASQEEQG